MPSVEVGTELDRYTLEELVARTNTASSFRATALRTGRQVAVKIPHPEVEGHLLFFSRFRLFSRFRREQETCERLNHPAVLRAFPDDLRSSVYMGDGVGGGTTAICEARRYIHAHGVAHRDLKPENIMSDAKWFSKKRSRLTCSIYSMSL